MYSTHMHVHMYNVYLYLESVDVPLLVDGFHREPPDLIERYLHTVR